MTELASSAVVRLSVAAAGMATSAVSTPAPASAIAAVSPTGTAADHDHFGYGMIHDSSDTDLPTSDHPLRIAAWAYWLAKEPNVPSSIAARAFAVHLFTAAGVALGFVALMAAFERRWTVMFWCLGVALFIDGIDGTFARRYRVAEVLPRWSGDTLDLVVDFITYVFVPAYAIAASGLLPSAAGDPGGAGDRGHQRALFRRPRHEDRRTTIFAAFRRCGTRWPSICLS